MGKILKSPEWLVSDYLFLRTCVLVSCVCSNKLLQTRGLKTAETYSPTAPGAGSLKSRCPQGCALPKGSSGDSVPRLFQLPVAVDITQISLRSLLLVAVCPLMSLTRTLVIGFRATWISRMDLSQDPWFNYIFEDWFPKEDRIHRSWGLGHRHTFLGVPTFNSL